MLKHLCINHADQKFFFNLKSSWIVLVSSFQFIWIPVLWFHDHYKYFTLLVRESSLDVRIWLSRRQILTSKVGSRAERVNVTSIRVFALYQIYITYVFLPIPKTIPNYIRHKIYAINMVGWRDSQLQVSEKSSYLTKWSWKIQKSFMSRFKFNV